MVKLSDFIGEIIKDLASARTYADYSAATASEVYHADPFMKSLPIPHYIIDEAEIDVPVMVVGVSTQSEDYSNKKQLFCDVLKQKLPVVLMETFQWNFINERIKLQTKEREKAGRDTDTTDYKNFQFNQTILAEFNSCIEEVVSVVVKKFTENLDLYNYAILKLLEITENLSKELKYALFKVSKTMRGKNKDINPFLTKESVENAVGYVGNLMFFHFMKIMQSDSSVHIDVNTGRMEEYAQKDCLMHIKIKVKEQDLNLVVEEQDNKKTRFLSLT